MNTSKRRVNKSPISEQTLLKLLENDTSDSDNAFSPIDDTDSDPSYEPDTQTFQKYTPIIDKCKRRLFSGYTCGAPEKKNVESPVKHMEEKCSVDTKFQIIQSRLHELRTQRILDQKFGRLSSARRKSKKIKEYLEAINNIKMGGFVDIDKLPLHTPSKTNDPGSSLLEPIGEISIEEDTGISILKEKPPVKKNIDEDPGVIKNKKYARKENYCILCKKTVKEFCKHYENVHKDTKEGQELRNLNKVDDKALKKKLKTKITDKLRKDGNAFLSQIKANESFLSGGEAIVIPVKRFCTQSSQINAVQCAHCKGFYRRRKFSQHLIRCQNYFENCSKNSLITKKPVSALSSHSLPVIKDVKGASEQLMSEVITTMKPRETLSVALRDPLIMKYASEFHKSRRATFQRNYVSRVITDLSRLVMRMREAKGEEVQCLQDVFNPAHFSTLVNIVLQEGGYDPESGLIEKCGLANRLRSHIKGAAQTAKKEAAVAEYRETSGSFNLKRKMLKHFLTTLDEKWANEVGRIFDDAVKMSRSETGKKIASEEDIIQTCQYINSKYRAEINTLETSQTGSKEKQQSYNKLLDLLITHIMCLIRRRPVDFKRGQNVHYEKLDRQEDMINEIKNSKYMEISDHDIKVCNQFQIFYVPGKGWKELVPIALTKLMKEAMDAIQNNKKHVGITSNLLFVRAREMPINPRESIRKVTMHLKLKKPLDLSGNGLRHHAGTFSKLHSSHPQYQDYLASALGHTLHIHKLHYEMPTSILQKLIVLPVLHNMTKPHEEREYDSINNTNVPAEQTINFEESSKDTPVTPPKITQSFSSESSAEDADDIPTKRRNVTQRHKWSEKEKSLIYQEFGRDILNNRKIPRSSVVKFYDTNKNQFKFISIECLVTFINNKLLRKQKNVTPEVKGCLHRHRKLTNVPI